MESEWEKLPLGELTENLDSIRVPVKGRDRKPGPYPYYGASGIVDYVDGFLFEGEHLLIAEDGENLRTRNTPVAFLADGKFWVNNHAHIVKGNGRATTKFLNYVLAVTDISGYLTGSTMPKLTQGNMNRIQVVAPPLEVQDAIASILGALDDKIELNCRINATLESLARAIFKSWFVDFDPVRMKSEGRMVKSESSDSAPSPFTLPPSLFNLFPSSFQDSELGQIPKGWEVGTVRDLCERVENGGTPKRKIDEYWEPHEIPWLTSGEVRQAFIIGTENFISKEGLENSSAKLWPPNTTVVALYGATAAFATLLGVEVSANQACCALIPNPESVAFNLLTLQDSFDRLLQQARGSAQQNLSQSIVADLKTLVPPNQILEEFNRRVMPLFEQCIHNERESLTLSTLRDTLLPKLLSGELPVPAALTATQDVLNNA